ncbi:MAG: MBL fold metallo-hydrolase [Myxococcales bacterium]|nr:MBL fold metallo-hydrolase [Myxococcales bacterium]MCB9581376.1 MBL fold metallo-hydrolase [Polyangiaceae bacterium]
MAFSICFWGVRGSIASPGPDTAAVGGNTSSVEVRCGAQRVLLDAGTGIRRLGESLLAEGPVRATLLLSHHHWDHIQGLPFFVPLYVPSTELTVIGPTPERVSVHDVLEHQMTSPVFPVRLDEVPCRLDTREVVPGAELLLDDVRIRVAKGNHPGGSLAYRIDYDGKSVVYATDTEHYSCVDPALERLAQGADVLIYDSQYTPAEYRGETGPSKVGWGHSTYEEGAALARAAGVRQLVLFHHDPKRTDAAVAELEAKAQSQFAGSVAAREGMVIDVGRRAQAA